MTRVRSVLNKRDVQRLPEMQREQIRVASYTGKDPLTVQQARRLAKKAKSKGKPLEPYRCPFCGSYHIGRRDPT